MSRPQSGKRPSKDGLSSKKESSSSSSTTSSSSSSRPKSASKRRDEGDTLLCDIQSNNPITPPLQLCLFVIVCDRVCVFIGL